LTIAPPSLILLLHRDRRAGWGAESWVRKPHASQDSPQTMHSLPREAR
jgi:hypothetical protein